MSTASARPTYTREQLEQYFAHINLPAKRWKFTVDGNASDLPFLSILLKHHLCAVPFENLDLHYAPVRGVSLDPDHMFHKVVERNAGRGGYCMQVNSFFGTVLRSLGFDVMSTGARVSNTLNDVNTFYDVTETSFGGLSHTVNIVIIDGIKYFVDVGFGSSGPTSPIELLNDEAGSRNTGTRNKTASSCRLLNSHIGNNTHKGDKQLMWVYQVKYGTPTSDKPWISCYSFLETEFFPSDFEIMSFSVSNSRTSLFVNHVLITKFIMHEAEDDDDEIDIIGDITLFDAGIKERRFGESKQLCDINTEQDRVQALEKYIGIKLSRAEIAGINRLPTAIAG